MFEMTKNVLQNLMGKSSTRLYPFAKRETFERFRGTLDIDVDECIFCGTCAKKCPSQCIEVDIKGRTWTCDSFACVYCSNCVEACPTQCMTMSNVTKQPAYEKDVIFYKGKPKEPKEKKAKAAKDEKPAG
jgi:ech hydrogenase subunit F